MMPRWQLTNKAKQGTEQGSSPDSDDMGDDGDNEKMMADDERERLLMAGMRGCCRVRAQSNNTPVHGPSVQPLQRTLVATRMQTFFQLHLANVVIRRRKQPDAPTN